MTDNNSDIMQGIINRINDNDFVTNDSNTDIDVDLDTNDTNNTTNNTVIVSKKFHYVCTEEQNKEKFDIFGVIKSNTKQNGCLIPLISTVLMQIFYKKSLILYFEILF